MEVQAWREWAFDGQPSNVPQELSNQRKSRFPHLSIVNPTTLNPHSLLLPKPLSYFFGLIIFRFGFFFILTELLAQIAATAGSLLSLSLVLSFPNSLSIELPTIISISSAYALLFIYFALHWMVYVSFSFIILRASGARTMFYLSLKIQNPALGLIHSKTSINKYGKKEDGIPI